MASQVLRAAVKVARQVLPASERASLLSGRGTVGMTPYTSINRRLMSSVTTLTENARHRDSYNVIKWISTGFAISSVATSGYMLMRDNAETAKVKSTTVKETNDTYISITRDRVDVYGNTKLLGTNRDLLYYYKGTQGNGTAFTLMNERGEVLSSTHQYDRGNCIIVIGDGISQNYRVQIVTDKPLYIHQR